jgi:hypothetical protein
MDFNGRIAKARAKRDVIKILTTFSPEEQWDVLADVIVELDLVDKFVIPKLENDDILKTDDILAGLDKLRDDECGRTGTVVKTLRKHPQLSISKLTEIVYPGEKDARNKVRAILFALKRQGRIKNVGTGRWEVVTK